MPFDVSHRDEHGEVRFVDVVSLASIAAGAGGEGLPRGTYRGTAVPRYFSGTFFGPTQLSLRSAQQTRRFFRQHII